MTIKIPKPKSALEELFAFQCKALKLPAPCREIVFCERKWRLDFAWPDIKLAVEIEGGIWTNGRHTIDYRQWDGRC